MELTCPSCQTKYNFDARELDEGQRDVQCSVCHHGWLFGESKATAETASAQQSTSLRRKKRKRSIISRILADHFVQFVIAWTFLFGFVGGGGYLFLEKGDALIKAYPQLAALHQIIFKSNPEELFRGLEILPLEVYSQFVEGNRILVIEGQIRNNRPETLRIPQIRASLLDRQGREISKWKIKINATNIEGNNTISWITEQKNPLLEAEKVLITFLTASEALLGEQALDANISENKNPEAGIDVPELEEGKIEAETDIEETMEEIIPAQEEEGIPLQEEEAVPAQ